MDISWVRSSRWPSAGPSLLVGGSAGLSSGCCPRRLSISSSFSLDSSCLSSITSLFKDFTSPAAWVAPSWAWMHVSGGPSGPGWVAPFSSFCAASLAFSCTSPTTCGGKICSSPGCCAIWPGTDSVPQSTSLICVPGVPSLSCSDSSSLRCQESSRCLFRASSSSLWRFIASRSRLASSRAELSSRFLLSKAATDTESARDT
eukprot:scaffold942_cov366-Prasinococcus_capsulatus_cf.AAC.3